MLPSDPRFVSPPTALKSHSTIQAILGAAGRSHSRIDVLRELCAATFRKGIYENSIEGMIPILKDFRSLLVLAVVLVKLLINPRSGRRLAFETITSYSLGSAIPRLSAMKLDELQE